MGDIKPVGRPSKFTASLADEICRRLSGGEPLAQICRDEHVPHPSTVRDWMTADAAFSRAIAHAREVGFDIIAADCLAIADQPNKRITADGEAHESDPQRDRLRIETRLKLLAKWDPKRYGEKVEIEHSGKDGGPIQTSIDVGKLGPEQLRALASIPVHAG